MKTARLIVIIVLGLMLDSCVGYYKKMTHLSDDELEWINCYNIGDTVLFQSENGQVDTLVVREIKIENSRNPFYIHFIDNHFQDDYFYANATYEFDIISSNNKLEGSFGFNKMVDNDLIIFKSRLNERSSRPFTYHDLAVKRTVDYSKVPKISNIIYNGDVLSDCIVYDETNTDRFYKYNDAVEIDSYIISKKYGLISYTLKSGETFTRVVDDAR